MNMRQIITAVLRQHGLLDAFDNSDDFHLRVENPPWLALVIERHGDKISIAHYVEQYGDLISDPEMTFSLRLAAEGSQGVLGEWSPLTVNPGGFGEREVAFFDDEEGKWNYYPGAFREAKSFANMWARNLRDQGFAKPGLKAGSITHPHLLKGASE